MSCDVKMIFLGWCSYMDELSLLCRQVSYIFRSRLTQNVSSNNRMSSVCQWTLQEWEKPIFYLFCLLHCLGLTGGSRIKAFLMSEFLFQTLRRPCLFSSEQSQNRASSSEIHRFPEIYRFYFLIFCNAHLLQPPMKNRCENGCSLGPL